jgi:histidinol-phosphate/aromatic aminotransferase/cobyric acid decarboxylase-like protein
MDELMSSFDKLVSQYPSGMQVNSLLAAKNFGVRPENIIVGNGASELIKSLMGYLEGKVGIIRPTFEEYPNRYKEDDVVDFCPNNADYTYNCQNVEDYFGNNPIDNLIVINPDNPSGNYIPKSDMLKLVEWTKVKGIKFIVDESFADFADEENNTLIDTTLLADNPHLYIMKSISKSYGVPGLRLGVLASGDENTISLMKKDVAIWNINSFAEFYMQIEEKYKNDYKTALDRFRKERMRFENRLEEIKGLRIIHSQANFIMAEIISGLTAHELTKCLAVKYNILIKDLSNKIKDCGRQYVRIAVKTTDENDKLIEALKDVLMFPYSEGARIRNE